MSTAAAPSTNNKWAVRLACALVKARHGNITEVVARHLATRGLQSLQDIVRGCNLPAPQVKQALLLLIQHNFVIAYTHKDEDVRNPKPPVNLYQADVDAMLQIIRHPRFVMHTRQELGEEAQWLVETLLENGRLTYDQMVKAWSAHSEVAEEQAKEPTRNLLMSLVTSRLVERAPPCNMPHMPARLHPDAVKKRSSRAAAGSAAMAAEQSAALRSLEEMRYDNLRFKLPNDLILAAAGEDATMADGEAPDGSLKRLERKRGREEEGEQEDLSYLEDDVGEENGQERETDKATARGKPAARGRGRGSKAAKIENGTPKPAAKQKIKAGTKAAELIPVGEGAAAALKQKAAEEAQQLAAHQDGVNGVLWRVNTQEFNKLFRHAACVEVARDKFNDDTAAVIEAMLVAGRSYESGVREERGGQLNFDEVTTHLRRLAMKRAAERAKRAQEQRALDKAEKAQQKAEQAGEGNDDGNFDNGDPEATEDGDDDDPNLRPDLTEEEAFDLDALSGKVPDIINAVSCDAMEFISYVGEGPAGSMYSVNISRFLEFARLKHLESAAKEKYGIGGMRIFRMLTLRGALEQKQVADFAMLPPKDTRELLYKMLLDGYVFMQDIPKTSDHAPLRTFYAWRADWPVTAQRFGNDLLQAAGNVYMRVQHETAQNQQLLDLVQAVKASGHGHITPAQRTQVAKLVQRLRMLEVSLLRLDSSIALFTQY